MLVAARDLGCLSEVLIIAAGYRRRTRASGRRRQQAADENASCLPTKSRFLLEALAWFQTGAVDHKKSNKSLVEACRPFPVPSAPARVA